MKKIKYLLITLLCIGLCACSSSKTNDENTLYLLNWGDYINPDLLTKFEDEYNVKVVMTEVESNEAMYEQIKTGRTKFDIAIPSDYMIDQLAKEKLIIDLDTKKIPNYNKDNFNNLALNVGIKSNDYVPYFNGTIGIMYNTSNIKDIKSIVEKYGWKVLFDSKLLPNAKIGMYNSSRDAFAAAELNLGINVNTTNDSELNKAYNLLKNMNYSMYGDDQLKKNVVTGNLDLALVYSGDYFEELIVAKEEDSDVNFGYYAPSSNNYWLDGMVIPTNAPNKELAYKFINFMLDQDNALSNAEYIGYASPLKSVMSELEKNDDYKFLIDNPYYDPSKIANFKPQTYRYLGLDYMSKLEELFTKSKE
ncbi:MAG: extracellular solute-binding protein [Bacilli bacterium]|nr:extracellular solute-binding protein [Bacilli bacterium]